MRNRDGCLVVPLALDVAILLMVARGWVSNIITLAHSGLTPLTATVIARFAGILVPPLGAILGFIK